MSDDNEMGDDWLDAPMSPSLTEKGGFADLAAFEAWLTASAKRPDTYIMKVCEYRVVTSNSRYGGQTNIEVWGEAMGGDVPVRASLKFSQTQMPRQPYFSDIAGLLVMHFHLAQMPGALAQLSGQDCYLVLTKTGSSERQGRIENPPPFTP